MLLIGYFYKMHTAQLRFLNILLKKCKQIFGLTFLIAYFAFLIKMWINKERLRSTKCA